MVSTVYSIISNIINLVFWGINIIITIMFAFLRITSSVLHTIIVYVPRLIGRFIPPSLSMELDQYLVYAGVSVPSEEVIGMIIVYSIVVSSTAFLVASILQVALVYKIAVSMISFVAVWIFPRVLLDALIYQRTQSVERVMPDILDIIAQNIRVGMTTDRALWSAARPEFGPLALELQAAARATLTGTPLPDALIAITNRVKSDRLERAIRLIIQGITSGGELPSILQTIAIDMRSEQNLLKQMASETNAHVMFISFAILFGAPLLFAVSKQFITVFSTLFSKIDMTKLSSLPQTASMMIMLQPFVISSSFYLKYALITIVSLCFFGSFLIGLLRTGRAIAGLSNVPVMMFMSLVVFLSLDYLLSTMFSGLFVI